MGGEEEEEDEEEEEEEGGWGGKRRRRTKRRRRKRERREEHVPLHTNNSTTTMMHFLELGLDRTLHFECMATRPTDAEGVGLGGRVREWSVREESLYRLKEEEVYSTRKHSGGGCT
jgi:hypothetical protein